MSFVVHIANRRCWGARFQCRTEANNRYRCRKVSMEEGSNSCKCWTEWKSPFVDKVDFINASKQVTGLWIKKSASQWSLSIPSCADAPDPHIWPAVGILGAMRACAMRPILNLRYIPYYYCRLHNSVNTPIFFFQDVTWGTYHNCTLSHVLQTSM